MSDTKNTTNPDNTNDAVLSVDDIEIVIPPRNGKVNIAGRALTGYERGRYNFGTRR